MIHTLRSEDFSYNNPLMGKVVKILDIHEDSHWYNDRMQPIGAKAILNEHGFRLLETRSIIIGRDCRFRSQIGCCYVTCIPIEDDPDDNY